MDWNLLIDILLYGEPYPKEKIITHTHVYSQNGKYEDPSAVGDIPRWKSLSDRVTSLVYEAGLEKIRPIQFETSQHWVLAIPVERRLGFKNDPIYHPHNLPKVDGVHFFGVYEGVLLTTHPVPGVTLLLGNNPLTRPLKDSPSVVQGLEFWQVNKRSRRNDTPDLEKDTRQHRGSLILLG